MRLLRNKIKLEDTTTHNLNINIRILFFISFLNKKFLKKTFQFIFLTKIFPANSIFQQVLLTYMCHSLQEYNAPYFVPCPVVNFFEIFFYLFVDMVRLPTAVIVQSLSPRNDFYPTTTSLYEIKCI